MTKRASPRQWTSALKMELCRRIAEGQTIYAIAGKNGFPSQSAIYAELRRDHEFMKDYEIAREWQLATWEDEIIELANDSSKDRLPDGRIDVDHIARMKLVVNTKQWVMSRRNPRKYGDRVSAEVSGPNGDAIEVKRELSAIEAARTIAFVLELGKREVANQEKLLERSSKELEH
jgi:hypothetical protein